MWPRVPGIKATLQPATQVAMSSGRCACGRRGRIAPVLVSHAVGDHVGTTDRAPASALQGSATLQSGSEPRAGSLR